nr:hypothetical protein BaRGS_012349 [Batillaria attramentaria]
MAAQQGGHTYPDGTTGGDYHAKMAAQQGGHTYPDGTTGGDYHAKMAAQQGHTYPDGTTGGDYHANMAAQQGGHTYPDGTTGGDYHAKMAAKQGLPQQGGHTYPDGTTGHNYPSVKAAQQQGGHSYPVGTTGGDYPSRKAQQSGFPLGGGFQQGGHTYPVGTEGGDYPSVKAAQGGFQQGHTYPVGTQGGDYPTVKAAQQGGFQQVGHSYPVGSEGGDYPTVKAAQNRGGGQFFPGQGSFKQQGQFQGAPSQGTVIFVPSGQYIPQSKQFPQTDGSGNFGNDQVYPPSSSSSRLYSPNLVDTEPRISVQRAPTFQGGPGTRNSFDSFAVGGSKGQRFSFPSSHQSNRQGQCFNYQDLSAGYRLSDVFNDNEYPKDAIMSELRAMPYMAPMVGYENLPKQKKSSPFGSFGSSLSTPLNFGFDDEQKSFGKLSNTKYFPPSFDEGRRECNLCGTGQGVNACVERYNWVSVIVYCPHWQRNERVQTIRLYLPQGCTCNRYEC